MSEMPEAQKLGFSAAPGISLRNSGANSPIHGRAVHADLLEHAAAHHRHDAAAAGRSSMVGALPGRTLKTPGAKLAKLRAGGQGVFQRLERSADVVAQGLEPGARARFA